MLIDLMPNSLSVQLPNGITHHLRSFCHPSVGPLWIAPIDGQSKCRSGYQKHHFNCKKPVHMAVISRDWLKECSKRAKCMRAYLKIF